MAPVCDGAGSHFALEQSLVIFVLWPTTLCKQFGQNRCILVVSQPLEASHRSGFSNLAATGIWSGHVIPLYGGVSKSYRLPCILSTRNMKAVT